MIENHERRNYTRFRPLRHGLICVDFVSKDQSLSMLLLNISRGGFACEGDQPTTECLTKMHSTRCFLIDSDTTCRIMHVGSIEFVRNWECDVGIGGAFKIKTPSDDWLEVFPLHG